MSTYWGLRCKYHEETSPMWFRNQPKEAEAARQAAPLLAQAMRVSEEAGGYGLEYHWISTYESPWSWLCYHPDCNMEVMNEYGQTWTDQN